MRAEVQNHIDLITHIVPEIIQVVDFNRVEALFQELRYHERLEKGAPERVRAYLTGIVNTQRLGCQAPIDEVELGRVHQAFIEILEVGTQQLHDAACLEHG